MKYKTALVTVLAMRAGTLLAECGHQGMGAACPTSGGPGFSMSVLYLISLGWGYWLLRLAEKEDVKFLKIVGRVVSWLILAVSVAGLLCKAGAGMCRWKSCSLSAARVSTCPYTPSSGGAQAPVEREEK